MCGIAGRLAVDGANASESAVARSLEAMRHRGPSRIADTTDDDPEHPGTYPE